MKVNVDQPKQPEQEPYPTVRLVSEDGKRVVYPTMVPDGKGGWEMQDPKAIAALLSEPSSETKK